MLDTFSSETNSHQISGSLSSIFSLVNEVKQNNSLVDPRLKSIPSMRIAEEDHISRKINSVACLVGQEKFYLKVFGVLHNIGADIGLRPDGVVTTSEQEKIDAGRVLEEKIKESEKHSVKVVNPCIGEMVDCLGQIDELMEIRSKFITQRLKDGASMKQASEESGEIDQKTITEIKETKKKIIENRKKTEKKIAKIIPEQRVSEDQLENLYATIYADETTPMQLIAVIDEVKASEAREQQLIANQKAKTAANKSFGAKIRQFLDNYADTQVAKCEVDQEVEMSMFRIAVPCLPRIFDAAAAYTSGDMSGNEAVIEGLKGATSDLFTMAVLGCVGKGVGAVGKASRKAIWGMVSKTPATTSYAERLGIKIQKTLNSKSMGIDLDPWKIGTGKKVETSVIETYMPGARQTPDTYPAIDAWFKSTRHGTSVKYMDATMPSYVQRPATVRYTLNRYNRKLEKYTGREWDDLRIPEGTVASKDTLFIIREGATQEQWNELARAISEWKLKGIDTHVWTIK